MAGYRHDTATTAEARAYAECVLRFHAPAEAHTFSIVLAVTTIPALASILVWLAIRRWG